MNAILTLDTRAQYSQRFIEEIIMRGACSNSLSADERARSVKGDHDLTKAAVAEMMAREDAERRAKNERLRALRLSGQARS